jgi:hypothetical protein
VLASHNMALLQSTCNKILNLENSRVKWFEEADIYFSNK